MKYLHNASFVFLISIALSVSLHSQSKVSMNVEHATLGNDTFYFQKTQYNSLNLSFSDNVSSFYFGKDAGKDCASNWNIGIGRSTLTMHGGAGNIAIGEEAMTQGIGGGNIAIGMSSLKVNEGSDNIGIGFESLNKNTSGNHLISIGRSALHENISGTNNIAIGEKAAYSNTIGDFNIAIGNGSLNSNTLSSYNIAIGDSSLYRNEQEYNLAIGQSALKNNVSGTNNLAIGQESLYNNGSGLNNLALGFYSLNSNVSGLDNLGIGVQSLVRNVDGNSNLAIGQLALGNIVNGSNNLAIGSLSMWKNKGSNNVGIGNEAGSLNVNGSGNIFIGFEAGKSEMGSEKLYIANSSTSSPLIYGEFDSQRLIINGKDNDGSTAAFQISDGARTLLMDGNKIDGSGTTYINDNSNQDIVLGGNVGIGISNPSKHLTIADASSPAVRFERIGVGYDFEMLMDGTPDLVFRGGTNGTLTSSNDLFRFSDDGNMWIKKNAEIGRDAIITNDATIGGHLTVCGTIGASVATVTQISCSSDYRFKQNIQPLKNSLNTLMSVRGVTYDWKTDEYPEKNFSSANQIGFIAQEIEKIFPSMVLTDSAGYKSVDYSRLSPVLVEAVKEQQEIIEQQAAEIEKLQSQLAQFENQQKNISAELLEIRAMLSKKDQ